MAPERISYQSGFGNTFSTEAVAGALPVGRNSPQRPPLGLYAEQFSGTAREDLATTLFDVERALQGARRRLDTVVNVLL